MTSEVVSDKERAMEFKSDEKKMWLEDENGKVVALLDYPEVAPGVVNFAHTEVDPSLGGQGIAAKITEAAAERLRREGLKAELSCSYSIRWFSKHPEYADVLADPEGEAIKAAALAGPACGIRRP
jgi:predicted GNAT family acetyltransferase